VFAFWRQSTDRRNNVFCIHNLSSQKKRIPVSSINLIATEDWMDLLSGTGFEVLLKFYQSVWLANRRQHLPY